MTLYALANVLVGFHLSRGETRYAWILAAAVPVQLVALALVPGGLAGSSGRTSPSARCSSARALRRIERARAARRSADASSQRAWRRSPVREGAVVARRSGRVRRALTWPLARHLGSALSGATGRTRRGTIWWLWHLQQEGATTSSGRRTTSSAARRSASRSAMGSTSSGCSPTTRRTCAASSARSRPTTSSSSAGSSSRRRDVRPRALPRLHAARRGLGRPRVHGLSRASRARGARVAPPLRGARPPAARSRRSAVRPVALRFALVGLATLAAWLTSGYFGVMAVIGAARSPWPPRLTRCRTSTPRSVASGALAATAVPGIGALSSISGSRARHPRARAISPSTASMRPSSSSPPPATSPSATASGSTGRRPDSTARTRRDEQLPRHPDDPPRPHGGCAVVRHRRRAPPRGRVRRGPGGRRRRLPAARPAEPMGRLRYSSPGPVADRLGGRPGIPSAVTLDRHDVTALVPLAALGLDGPRRPNGVGAEADGAWSGSPSVAVAMIVSFGELTTEGVLENTRTVPHEYAAVQRAPDGLRSTHSSPTSTASGSASTAAARRRSAIGHVRRRRPAHARRPRRTGHRRPSRRLGVTAIVTPRR